MDVTPFQLRYRLSRKQRLGVLMKMDGIALTVVGIVLLGFFCYLTLVSARALKIGEVVVGIAMVLVVFLLWRRVLLGLVGVLLVKWWEMDVVVEQDAAGILLGGQRWYLFLDCITSIEKYREDVWTIHHFNGFVLN